MDPELNDFLDALPGVTVAWAVFCFDEGIQIGDSFNDRDEASLAADAHAGETGHAAIATTSFIRSDLAVGSEALLTFLFCFRFNGRPWQTVAISAPSPEAATISAEGIVALLNGVAPAKGFAPLFDATNGACPG